MGAQYSSEIKYMYANIHGNRVAIPYLRLSSGQWVPLYQQLQNFYHHPHQGALMAGNHHLLGSSGRHLYGMANQSDYYLPGNSNQVYYGNFFR